MKTASENADLVIRNAQLIDGTGNDTRPGGLAVRDDTIIAVGAIEHVKAAREIDAGGKTLAPGFIDAHTHDDRLLLTCPTMDCKVSQGVTTIVAGNCGVSLAPLSIEHRPPQPLDLVSADAGGFFADFDDYLIALDRDPPSTNALCQVGHTTLRVAAVSDLQRPASDDEINAMRDRLEAALDAGAVGLSTGLFYPPAKAATTEEVIKLAELLFERGGIHTTHMRDETDGVVESLEETFRIGREAEVPVVVSHHKCAGSANFGRSVETLRLIDQARHRQSVGLDAYPYTAGSTMLGSGRHMGASRIIVSWSDPHPEYAGCDLDHIALELGMSLDDAVDVLSPAGGIFFMMDEGDVRRILAYPDTMIGSDGLPHDRFPHPRLWGTFPRVLGHYAREVKLFRLEEAVRKMTALPAQRFGLVDRGLLRPGYKADLVIFDPARVADTASFEHPTSPATGIELVMVNGRAVWQEGRHTGARTGQAIRLQALSPSRAAEQRKAVRPGQEVGH